MSHPLPTSNEIQDLLASLIAPAEIDEQLIRTCGGLTKEEIRFGVSLAQTDSNQVSLANTLLNYKVSRLKSLGLDLLPAPEVTSFGGMQRIKQALREVKSGFSPLARQLNLPLPKAWLLVGPPGTGKSFAAQVAASYLGFPLISLSVDQAIASGSAFLRRLLQRIEASQPALVFIDEFDKFFLANNANGEDSNTKQVLGVFLTWFQEKRSQTFVIATLNRLDALPPELIRAGRFDRIFYVGFPSAIERQEIIQLHASRFDRRYLVEPSPLTEEQWPKLLRSTYRFTGAELLSLVVGAAWHSFFEEFGYQFDAIDSAVRPGSLQIEFRHLWQQRQNTTPLFQKRPDDVLAIENRAKDISEPAGVEDESIYAPVPTTLWGEKLPEAS